MKVLVDTCVWSRALRRGRSEDDPVVRALEDLIRDMRVQMIGPIRQELLSGIRSSGQFESLRVQLNSFPDILIETQDYERAAEFFNRCRENGIQGSNTDFLICAIAVRCSMPIFTVDKDFTLFRKHLPIELFEIPT